MKPKYDLTIKFGIKGAVVMAGCVILAYGEGQESQMIEDFKKYLECPEEFEKMYDKPTAIGAFADTMQNRSKEAVYDARAAAVSQSAAVHGHTRKQF